MELLSMELGQVLAGRYKIIERIGSGGMSTVYRAHEIGLEREVAIKVLITALTSDAGLVERFNREARTIANLQHPNIIPIYFYGTEDSFGSFLVMPLLKGGTLDQRLKQLELRPSITEVGELADKLGNALQFAHDRGIVHRDIKFSNIMFDDTGSPYLSDFGIAKMLGGTNLTGTGMTVGTPQFMPPEQWRNDDITPAVDQYALAVLLYAMLTQHMPFDAPTPHALMYQHLQNEPPRASSFREDVPEAIEDALTRALAKNPSDRFPTIAEFTGRIAETARSVTREYSGFFKAPVEYAPLKTNNTPKQIMPDTPTEMGDLSTSTKARGEKPPTQIVSETRLEAANSGMNRRAFFGGMLAVLVIGLLVIGGGFAYVMSNRPQPTETDVRLDASDTAIVIAVAAASEEATLAPLTEVASETKLPSATATETLTPSITPSNTPDLTTTALAAFATNSANEQATENAQLRLTGTALAELATNRAREDMTATQAVRIAVQTAEANANSASTATVAAATSAALADNRNATSTAIAIVNQQQQSAIKTATAQSAASGVSGTATAFALIQNNIATQQAYQAATQTAQALLPTNEPVEGNPINYGQAQSHTANAEDSQVYYFEGKTGDIVTISASSRDFDTFLEIYYDGALISSDDDSGYNTDSRIANVQLQETDIYAILLRAYDGSMTGEFSIGVTEMLDCPNTQASRLLVGELARVTLSGGANRLRTGTSTESDLLDSIPEGGSFTVLEGPHCADSFAWYRVDFNGTIGWTAEGDESEYWLELIPDGEALLLTGGTGLTDGAELDAGAFQIEYFCTSRGYTTSNDGTNWYCENESGVTMITLQQSDFDEICQETYHNDAAFALQDGEGVSPAFRWRCYGNPE
jgi:eukaryotic-like serine/threonine-protein kinase